MDKVLHMVMYLRRTVMESKKKKNSRFPVEPLDYVKREDRALHQHGFVRGEICISNSWSSTTGGDCYIYI